jgi:ABC-2 type transport system ATP-binding protein
VTAVPPSAPAPLGNIGSEPDHADSVPPPSTDVSSARGQEDPANGDPAPAVEVRDLRKRYGPREVLRGVSFRVASGELFALLGPNGAGKTTTVEILEGYRRADGGEVRVFGLDPARDGDRLRPRIGLMLQEGGVDPRTTPREALHLYARFYRDPVDPDALLEAVELGAVAGTRYRRLSGGERQRLGLALALLGRPDLLVLDEPTAGMDPAAKAATRERIAALRASGTTILLTTHDLADVERLADRVAVLDRGHLVAHGTPAELTGAGAPRIRARVAGPMAEADRAALEAALRESAGDRGLRVEAGATLRGGSDAALEVRPARTADPALIAALAAWCGTRGLLLVELHVGAATLEERYLELVGPAAAEDAP